MELAAQIAEICRTSDDRREQVRRVMSVLPEQLREQFRELFPPASETDEGDGKTAN